MEVNENEQGDEKLGLSRGTCQLGSATAEYYKKGATPAIVRKLLPARYVFGSFVSLAAKTTKQLYRPESATAAAAAKNDDSSHYYNNKSWIKR